MRLRVYPSCSLNAKQVFAQRRRLIPDDKVYPESAQPLKTIDTEYGTSYHGRSVMLIYFHLVEDKKDGITFELYLA
jgi:hypothetical protein